MIRFSIQLFLLSVLTGCFALPAAAQDDFREIELTDAQIENYIKADPALQDILKKIDDAGDATDTNLIDALEGVAKEHGFKSFEELDAVAQTVAFIMTGFDQESGEFTEPRKEMQEEIAALQEDKSIPEKERGELLKELEEAVKMAPDVKYKSNIALVKKYMRQLIKLDEQTH